MLNLFQMLDACEGLGPVVAIIAKGVFPIIQIGIPILLILMGSFDLGKAVVSNDDKEIKGATSKLIKRAIMALAVFFVVLAVKLVFGWISKAQSAPGGGDVSGSDWWSCWNQVVNGNSNNAADEQEG